MPLPPGRLKASRRWAKRFLRQYAVLRRGNQTVWEGMIRVDMVTDPTTSYQFAQSQAAAQSWEISFPYGTDVRSGDEVSLTDSEFTPTVPPRVFEILNDGGPYTDQVVNVAVAFETRPRS